jgi:glucoamylase
VSPRWTSSSKTGIGKAINSASDVSFTLSHGVVNEVFFPREDIACIRDIEFLVTDGNNFFSEEKRNTSHTIKWMKEGVPAFHIINVCKQKKYCLEKEVITDPIRNTLLQQIIFKPSGENKLSNLNLYVILSPHINNHGKGNDGWKGEFKGVPMLFARRGDITIALACSSDFLKCSVGYVGNSDGYTDLKQHKKMEWEYPKTDDGNIALTAQIDISKNKKIVVAVGFGHTTEEAGNNAWASILDGFELAKEKYIYEWERWQRSLTNIKSDRNRVGRNFRTSAAVLRVHESKKFPGGVIASLSIPWGQSKGDGNLGGYHLVWPRDLVLSSGGFLELDAKDDVLRILNYVMTTQEKDGRWSQNMWLDGGPYWTGIQMDQIALAILLVNTSYQKKYVDEERSNRYWPIVKKALCYLIANGPWTQQDRWEEESGYTLFTISAEIAALLAGAALAEANNEKEIAKYCKETADYWNGNIEKWTYVTGTSLSEKIGVDGYYMRINSFDLDADEVKDKFINLKNHVDDNGKILLGELICVDALALVRFGLRDANDPRILNTIKAIDATLKVETPSGPCWHRYNKDGYGEDKDGNPYEGHGIGRAWPLLTGERAHYEIAAGSIGKAIELLKAMELFANNFLLPEQIWDTHDIPEKGLFFGKHTGSAMPLTWAHAEYIKLCSSIKAKKIVDMPQFTQERYIKQKVTSPYEVWRFNNQRKNISNKKTLRIEVMAEAIIRWTNDDWQTSNNLTTEDTGLGIFVGDISLNNTHSEKIIFTFFWIKANHWEENEFEINVTSNEKNNE